MNASPTATAGLTLDLQAFRTLCADTLALMTDEGQSLAANSISGEKTCFPNWNQR